MKVEALNYKANLAHDILNTETQYKSNKLIISNTFNRPLDSDFLNVVKNRLTIIDSYYSTQMNKRLYGIDDLAEGLSKYDDDLLKLEVEKFLNNPLSENIINKLFRGHYGINKSGKSSGKAISLISKYLFFLTDYKFPIYDSLAELSLKLLKEHNLVNYDKLNPIQNFYLTIVNINKTNQINDYEKLDNLLWLLGKLSSGSFTLLMSKSRYMDLINRKELKQKLSKTIKSVDKDKIIREYIKENYHQMSEFKSNEVYFFDFVFNLIKN